VYSKLLIKSDYMYKLDRKQSMRSSDARIYKQQSVLLPHRSLCMYLKLWSNYARSSIAWFMNMQRPS